MTIKPLRHFALSLSLMLIACAPQANPLQAPATLPQLSANPTQVTQGESVSFRYRRPASLRTQAAEPDKLAFISMTLVGDGIEGTRSNSGGLIAIAGGEATATISGLPIQPGKLRVVSVQGYDAARNPLPAFIGKGVYTSRAGTTRIAIEINRRQWLTGRALELLLASNASLASSIDLVALQASVDGATGYSNGSFETDPSLFNPSALAVLLADVTNPTSGQITDSARRAPGELSIDVSTSGGGAFAEALTVIINDPASQAQIIPSGSSSAQNLDFSVSPGTWTLQVRQADGTPVSTRQITVDADGMVTAGAEPLSVSGAAEGPVLSSLSPVSGTIGQTITLTGTSFSTTAGGNTVRFGSTVANVSGQATSTSLQVIVPSGISGPQTITVEAAGQQSSGQSFAVIPTLTGRTPAGGT